MGKEFADTMRDVEAATNWLESEVRKLASLGKGVYAQLKIAVQIDNGVATRVITSYRNTTRASQLLRNDP
jgi:hypothetical protein